MAVLLWLALRVTNGIGMPRGPELAILVFGGAAVYFPLTFAVGALSPADLRAGLRRKR